MSPRGRSRAGFVRTYTVTAGRSVPSRPDLDVADLLTAADPAAPVDGLTAYEQRAVACCRAGWLSLMEIAYHLDLPVSVARVLATGLIDSGRLTVRNPIPAAEQVDRTTLEKVLHGLQRL